MAKASGQTSSEQPFTQEAAADGAKEQQQKPKDDIEDAEVEIIDDNKS